jgi:O-antigen biosynthesis protein
VEGIALHISPIGKGWIAMEPNSTAPLISCIMPTHQRLDFALQSVRLFQRQDYPNRELIVVDDGEDGLGARLPDDPRIRYIRPPTIQSTAAKRNLACEVAEGSLIAMWDDDDWYGNDRLSAQAQPILDANADMSALTPGLIFDLERWEWWECSPELRRRMLFRQVHSGTVVFRRSLWEAGITYPLVPKSSDYLWLRAALEQGGRLASVDGLPRFIYLRHPGNTWRFTCGRHIDPRLWGRAAEPALPAEDRAFFAARSRALHMISGRWPGSAPSHVLAPRSQDLGADQPLVTCGMPTYNRRRFVPLAIHCFLCQDYPNRELIIVDDGDDPIADLVPPDPRIRYVPLDKRLSLGAKRNLIGELARGDIIVHWDDDDWSAPHRVSYQVATLLREQADLGTISRTYYYEPATRRAWLHAYPLTVRALRDGGTLCYRRALWKRSPFPDTSIGEDTRFVRTARSARAAIMTEYTWYVALIHNKNVSWKARGGPHWYPRPLTEIQHLLGTDIQFFEHARPKTAPAVP